MFTKTLMVEPKLEAVERLKERVRSIWMQMRETKVRETLRSMQVFSVLLSGHQSSLHYDSPFLASATDLRSLVQPLKKKRDRKTRWKTVRDLLASENHHRQNPFKDKLGGRSSTFNHSPHR